VLEGVMTKFNVPTAMRPIAKSFLKGFVQRTDDADLAGGLVFFRDEILPYILTGKE
jgi:hypothetical protein